MHLSGYGVLATIALAMIALALPALQYKGDDLMDYLVFVLRVPILFFNMVVTFIVTVLFVLLSIFTA